MNTVRQSMFSGSWYPRSPAECEKEIASFLRDAKVKGHAAGRTVGGIVPHAGWHFSGSIACNVIYALSREPAVDVFVLFGMHLHPDSPAYLMKTGAWETPFGDLAIEETLAEELAKAFPLRIETAHDYIRDNTIELQLPFIKYFSAGSKIIPLGVPPRASSLKIAKSVIEMAHRMGISVKVVGSTDLTHYGSTYGFLPRGSGPAAVDWVRNENDRKIIELMLRMDPQGIIEEALSQHNACCSGAAAAAVAAAKKLGAKSAQMIAYTTSYDIYPDSNFVGYAGILFYLDQQQRASGAIQDDDKTTRSH